MESNHRSGFDDLSTDSPTLFQEREKKTEGVDRKVSVDLIQSDPYELHYSCLLIPRFASQKLRGDLADYLPQWLQQVCVSYGWRLENYNVGLDYLGWSFCVPPVEAPEHFMTIIRNKISVFVLSNFGGIRREVLSNDFWAPGYLVVSGSKLIGEDLIQRYIHLTRRSQARFPPEFL